MTKAIYATLMMLFFAGSIFAQNQSVGINNNGSSPDGSAMLDVSSTTKGFLLPRMTQAQRNAIPTPANGLLVWCNNCGTNGELQVYNGAAWTNLTGGNALGTVPGAPTIGTATAGNAQASVPFTQPASNGGSAITSYTATSNPGGYTGTLNQAGTGVITVTGLTNGQAYTFTVTATNANGTGVASASSNSVTPATVPDAPTIGTATSGNTWAAVPFTQPASNGGSTITSYTAYSNPGNITGTLTQSGSGSITVNGLTNGTAYTFTVKATNVNGQGATSAASNSVTPASTPDAPTIGTAIAGNAQASVPFTQPASNGGSIITSYTATSTPGNFTGTLTQAGSGTITVTGLANGTAYTFKVKATNAAGTGAESAASNSVTPAALVVGDNYQGGKIAYILISGDPGYNASVQHGIIAALADQSNEIAWITGGSTATTANNNTSSALGTGQANTNAMKAQTGYTGGAAKVCDDYVNSETGTGVYTDWYVPSKDELYKVYQNRGAIGGFIGSYYWSSTEYNAVSSYNINWSSGDTNNYNGKVNAVGFSVRAIRSF